MLLPERFLPLVFLVKQEVTVQSLFFMFPPTSGNRYAASAPATILFFPETFACLHVHQIPPFLNDLMCRSTSEVLRNTSLEIAVFRYYYLLVEV